MVDDFIESVDFYDLTEEDILLQPVPDRRKLPHVPDASQRRTHVDRRGYCENAASRQDYEQSKAKED